MSLIKDTRTATRLAVLALIAGISTLVVLQNQSPETDTTPAPALGVSYFVNSAELSGTGSDGRILFRLIADRAEQVSADTDIDLTNITISYAPSAEVPWDLFADTGKVPPDGKLVKLRGNVVVVSKDPETPQTTLTTDRMELLPDEKLARTDDRVKITRDGQVVNGTGMKAYLNTSEVKLLSDVSGTYEPQR